MAKLIVYNNVSLDGYFTGENGDIGWFKDHGTEMPSSTGATVHWPERRLHLLWQSSPQYLRIHGSRLREENELEK
jgi:hypothetical protein